MKLSALHIPGLEIPSGADAVEITALTADSRAVTPGALFAALPGTRTDGARFVRDAAERGAAAVLAPLDFLAEALPAIPILRAEDPRRALALLAAQFHAGQPATTVAVTGTSGKTSVVEFTRQLYGALGRPAASLGTLGLIRPDGGVYGGLTTPDPVALHRTLSELARDGVTHLAFEASSHGLDQRRLDGVKLAAAAYLNLGRDHLDYHRTADDYFAAKLRLFEVLLEPGRWAVINTDDARSPAVVAAARRRGHQVLTVGRAEDASLRLLGVAADGLAQRMLIAHGARRQTVLLPLLGSYQASNALMAAGLAIATGEDPAVAIAGLEALKGVAGRLDIAGRAKGALVVVDYAHKPDALEAALSALRPFARGRLICVFGCGGDRDKGKRPIMGAIAARLADVVIVTDDNPRSEDPAAIRTEILAGAAGAIEIGDRAAAIQEAIDTMRSGDVVLIAGKGHETGQIIGASVIPFSDHAAVEQALAAIAPGTDR